MRILLLLIALAVATQGRSQQIPHDTSFTVFSAYTKAREKYPFIQVVKPLLKSNIISQKNIVYSKRIRDLRLDIFLPHSPHLKSYPGILLIHGGGWRSGDKSQVVPMAQALVKRGYVAVAVEYTLSLEAPYPAAVDDLKAALHWMRDNANHYNLDKTKIAALGFSAGGQLAALVGALNGAENKNNIQAVVDVDGILAFKHPQSEEGASAALWLGGTYDQKPETWRDASALTHVNIYTPPMLFINSALPRFHAGRDDMVKKLDSLKIYSKVYTLPDTPHTFWLFKPWFEPTVNYVADFLDGVFRGGKQKAESEKLKVKKLTVGWQNFPSHTIAFCFLL